MNFLQGEIIYIKFPFTDFTNYKLRPALVISNKNYNIKENIIVIGIFGNKGIEDFSIELNQEDLENGKMLKKSYFRFQNIFTLDKSLFDRKIGKLKKAKLEEIVIKLMDFIKI